MSDRPVKQGQEHGDAGAPEPAMVDSGTHQVVEDVLAVRGVVRDSLGVPLPRAVVTLAVSGGRQLEKTKSAADGTFEVVAPECGAYLLSAFSPQLGDQSVTVHLDGRAVEVEFRITVHGTVAE